MLQKSRVEWKHVKMKQKGKEKGISHVTLLGIRHAASKAVTSVIRLTFTEMIITWRGSRRHKVSTVDAVITTFHCLEKHGLAWLALPSISMHTPTYPHTHTSICAYRVNLFSMLMRAMLLVVYGCQSISIRAFRAMKKEPHLKKHRQGLRKQPIYTRKHSATICLKWEFSLPRTVIKIISGNVLL